MMVFVLFQMIEDNLYERHVRFIDIWTFFAVNFDVYEMFVQYTSCAFIFERFSFHNVTQWQVE